MLPYPGEMLMSDTTSDSVRIHAQRIAELVTANCNSMLETSLILPRLVQAIDSLDTLLRTISQFEIGSPNYRSKLYELRLDVPKELASNKPHVSLYISTSETLRGVYLNIPIPAHVVSSGTNWQQLRNRISAENMDEDSAMRVLLTAQTIACNIDKIIQWLESTLEDVNQRNRTLLGYIDTMRQVFLDPEISKLLVLGATTPRE
jgi:hypothetical protein